MSCNAGNSCTQFGSNFRLAPHTQTLGVVEWGEREACTDHSAIDRDLKAVRCQEIRCHTLGLFDHR